MSNLFALPVPVTQQPRSNGMKRQKKRKRRTETESWDGKQNDHADAENTDDSLHNEEYTAVVSPDERTQRRQAGISLEQPLPASPFPHKDVALPKKPREINASGKLSENQSLRLQHISNMTAVLHKSFRDKDWPRARRALGLLLRTEIGGQSLDLRNGEYWGIGAEILFRYQPDRGMTWSRRGFEDAKDYYEKLIVHFPYHRASSNNVNAIDFYLALFSLWIFVAQAERASLHSANNESLDHDAVGRELDEARVILGRITKCMGTAPYADNKHFKQLKADVVLWQSNLESEYGVGSPMMASSQSPENDLSAAAGRLSL